MHIYDILNVLLAVPARALAARPTARTLARITRAGMSLAVWRRLSANILISFFHFYVFKFLSFYLFFIFYLYAQEV